MPEKTAENARGKSLESVEKARAMREQELIIKVTKEIVVKFVEMGKVTPASFREVFSMVHATVKDAVDDNE